MLSFLDPSHKCFDMRKLIVGMSRATHGQYVHVATCADEKRMLGLAKPTAAAQSTEPDWASGPMEDMMTGSSQRVDEEEDWDPSLY